MKFHFVTLVTALLISFSWRFLTHLDMSTCHTFTERSMIVAMTAIHCLKLFCIMIYNTHNEKCKKVQMYSSVSYHKVNFCVTITRSTKDTANPAEAPWQPLPNTGLSHLLKENHRPDF